MQIELIAQITGLVIMIVIGIASRSIWALVAGGLVGSLATTMLSHTWMSGHANGFHWEPKAFRELLEFGKWVFVSSFVGVLCSSGDTLLLGSFMPADLLGVYVIAALIVGAVPSGLTRLFAMVAMPALSEVARNDPTRLSEIYYKFRLPVDLLLLFLMGLLFAAGQLIIDLLYDTRYSAAGGVVQVLAVSLFASRFGLAIQLYLAAGKPRYLTLMNFGQFVAMYSVVPAMYYFAGMQGAIWGVALHGLAVVPLVFFLNAKLGALNLQRELIVLVAMPFGFLCGSALNLLRG
jgi:O-antigen/teichoic acid export membrane protein